MTGSTVLRGFYPLTGAACWLMRSLFFGYMIKVILEEGEGYSE
jgi:hypothetical protein